MIELHIERFRLLSEQFKRFNSQFGPMHAALVWQFATDADDPFADTGHFMHAIGSGHFHIDDPNHAVHSSVRLDDSNWVAAFPHRASAVKCLATVGAYYQERPSNDSVVSLHRLCAGLQHQFLLMLQLMELDLGVRPPRLTDLLNHSSQRFGSGRDGNLGCSLSMLMQPSPAASSEVASTPRFLSLRRVDGHFVLDVGCEAAGNRRDIDELPAREFIVFKNAALCLASLSDHCAAECVAWRDGPKFVVVETADSPSLAPTRRQHGVNYPTAPHTVDTGQLPDEVNEGSTAAGISCETSATEPDDNQPETGHLQDTQKKRAKTTHVFCDLAKAAADAYKRACDAAGKALPLEPWISTFKAQKSGQRRWDKVTVATLLKKLTTHREKWDPDRTYARRRNK